MTRSSGSGEWQYLVAARVVEDALVPALHLKKKAFGDSDEYKAMRADAVSLPPLHLVVSLSLPVGGPYLSPLHHP